MSIAQQLRSLGAGVFSSVLCVALYTPRALAHEGSPECQNSQKTAIVEARGALEKDPTVLATRVRLADAYAEVGCFDDAVHVLEQGEEFHPRSSELQKQLRTTRSLLSEQQYFDGLERAEQGAKLSRLLLRCNKLGDVGACNEAIALKPDDADILSAKGDALLQASRPADALTAYRHAAALAPSSAGITERIAAAEARRLALFATCQNEGGDPALQACDAAMMRGAADEFLIHKRKAILLQAANQPSQALDAYIAANMIKTGDKSVALGIVTLSESTPRKDVLALQARGSALLTLGRAMEALLPLRQALALAPGTAGMKSQLATAERLAAVEARQRIAAAQSSPTSAAVAGTRPNAPARRYSNSAPPTRSN